MAWPMRSWPNTTADEANSPTAPHLSEAAKAKIPPSSALTSIPEACRVEGRPKFPQGSSRSGDLSTVRMLKPFSALAALFLSAGLICAPAHAQLTKEAQALQEFGK